MAKFTLLFVRIWIIYNIIRKQHSLSLCDAGYCVCVCRRVQLMVRCCTAVRWNMECWSKSRASLTHSSVSSDRLSLCFPTQTRAWCLWCMTSLTIIASCQTSSINSITVLSTWHRATTTASIHPPTGPSFYDDISPVRLLLQLYICVI